MCWEAMGQMRTHRYLRRTWQQILSVKMRTSMAFVCLRKLWQGERPSLCPSTMLNWRTVHRKARGSQTATSSFCKIIHGSILIFSHSWTDLEGSDMTERLQAVLHKYLLVLLFTREGKWSLRSQQWPSDQKWLRGWQSLRSLASESLKIHSKIQWIQQNN